ncbi:MAG: FkbM family methyltransferase [Alistipes sp.]
MKKLLHKLLYRNLSLENYLRVVSRLFFITYRLGIGRHAAATEYVYHLPRLVQPGATAIDIGANLGYYARPLSEILGTAGCLYAVEPVRPVFAVLSRNMRHCRNVHLMNYALGTEEQTIRMGNDSARQTGYLGTGQNFVNDSTDATDVEFTAEMRRGSVLFAKIERLDFIKCDIEGYEVVVMNEIRPLLERFHPTVLIETGGANRAQIIALFTALGYKGSTLHHGTEVALQSNSHKDIIFRYTKPCA